MPGPSRRDPGRSRHRAGRWRQGRSQEEHQRLLALRDDGQQVLRPDPHSVSLNFIAGRRSTVAEPEQVQYCKLAHDLLEFGDAESALPQAGEGLERCRSLAKPRLSSALPTNRVIARTASGRAAAALPDMRQVCAVPTAGQGRGHNHKHFETLAIAAQRAGDMDLGRRLVAAASATARDPLPDERHERAQAQVLLAIAEGDRARALQAMQPLEPWRFGADDRGLSLRVRGSGLQLLPELQEAAGLPGMNPSAYRKHCADRPHATHGPAC